MATNTTGNFSKKRRGNNEGSIFQRPNGTWRSQIRLEGKRLSFGGTKSECQSWLRKMQEQIEQGLTITGSQSTLEAFILKWIKTAETSLRPRTAVSYRQIIRDYIIPYLGKYKIKDLRPDQVEHFYIELQQNGVGVRTIRYVHSVLHRALERAVFLGYLIRNPAHGATRPCKQKKEMLVLDPDQVSIFLLAAESSPYKALYHIAVVTGMRQGEILGLLWNDINFVKGTISIQRQHQRIPDEGIVPLETKTLRSTRTVRILQNTLQVLSEHCEKQVVMKASTGGRWKENGYVFTSSIGTPLDQRNLLRDFASVLKRTDLPKIRFHDLRHTAVSLILNGGIPVIVVSSILGHSKPSITLDVYGHIINELQDDAARLMEDLIAPVKIGFQETSNAGENRLAFRAEPAKPNGTTLAPK